MSRRSRRAKPLRRAQPTPAAGRSEGWSGRAWLALLAVLAFACLLRAPLAAIPLERDEGEYAYVAWRWIQGDIPYTTAFDQKPPGVFAAYAGILSTLGGSPSALHWGAQIWTLGTLALVFALGKRTGGIATGGVAAALLALLTAEPRYFGNAANTEIFMLLPLVGAFLAAWYARERDSSLAAALAGVLSAAAILFKQPALWNALYAGAIVVVETPVARSVRRGVAFVGALGGALIAAALGFAAVGALGALWDSVIGYNLSYAAVIPLWLYPFAFWISFSHTLRPLAIIYALAALGLATGLAAPDPPLRRSVWILGGFALASGLGVATGGYFREHYYIQAAPALALLAAVGLSRLLPPAGSRRTAPTLLALAIVLGIALSAAPWYWLPGRPEAKARRIYGGNPFPEAGLVARWIAEHTGPQETVFVLGSEPEIYFSARRRAASRYIYVYPLMTGSADAATRQLEALAELAAKPPSVVVTVTVSASFLRRPDVPHALQLRLRERLAREYQVVARVPAGNPDRLDPVSEEEARRRWEADPSLEDAGVWGTLAVWVRRP